VGCGSEKAGGMITRTTTLNSTVALYGNQRTGIIPFLCGLLCHHSRFPIQR